MDIHIPVQLIKEILLIGGYLVIGGIFGAGFLFADETGERIAMATAGIIFAVLWRFTINLIF